MTAFRLGLGAGLLLGGAIGALTNGFNGFYPPWFHLVFIAPVAMLLIGYDVGRLYR